MVIVCHCRVMGLYSLKKCLVLTPTSTWPMLLKFHQNFGNGLYLLYFFIFCRCRVIWFYLMKINVINMLLASLLTFFFVYFRVMTNKMILIVIILLELAALGGLVYWKFFSWWLLKITQRVITGISHLFKLGCIYVIVLWYFNFKE